MEYYCPNCKKDVDAPTCPTCTLPTEPKSARSQAPARSVLVAGGEPRTSALPRPIPRVPPASSATSDTVKVKKFLDMGYEVFLIAGIFESGKSELLASYRQSAYLNQFARVEGRVLRTPTEVLNCHAVQVGRRKVMFVDASGEHFRQLYPPLRQTELGKSQIEFLSVISQSLRGLILLLDLSSLWGPELSKDPSNSRQVEILAWVLVLLRWLRDGGKYEEGPVSLKEQANNYVMTNRNRLDIPVQVLFSKADRLNGLLVPQRPGRHWLHSGTGVHRTLYPAGEDPLLLAYHCLPNLLEAVSTHASHFRFDFVHSLVTDRDTDEIIDPEPCGVTLSLEWLLDPNWQRRWLPKVPSRYWLGLQRFIDGLVKRSRRWQRLPDPMEVRG